MRIGGQRNAAKHAKGNPTATVATARARRVLGWSAVLMCCFALFYGVLTQRTYAAEDAEGQAVVQSDGSSTYTVDVALPDSEEKIAVEANAPEGTLPEGAKLHAELLSDETDTKSVADELDKADVTYDGFTALDVHFTNADGEEVEPTGKVDVKFELPQAALGDDVDASTLAVQHLAEDENGNVEKVDAVADAGDATQGTVETTDDKATADFSVDSFSTFTITWNNSTWSGLTVHCVDGQGNEIGSNLNDVNRNSTVTVSDIAPEIEGYTYDHAVVTNNAANIGSANRVQTIYYRSNQWYWQNTGDPHTFNGWQELYLVYSKQLDKVETVDSTAEGVHMYMFDYDNAAFSSNIGGYYEEPQGATREGLASSTTTNGWPSITQLRNGSFSNWFGGTDSAFTLSDALDSLNNNGRQVNHLFDLDKFKEDGTFYYSSFENFATLANDNDNDFTVYDALGTPNDDNQYFYQRGNFMPYDTLDTSNVANENLYDEDGVALSADDPSRGDPVYGLTSNNPNYYFGMYVWADFYQPENGIVVSNDGTTSKDMVFEFTGDDDMWVYIDGVLVLDLGGIHDAQSGSINFATGEITWTDTPTSDHTHPDRYKETSTLLEQYTKAGVADNYDFDGNTFADGTSHTIQIFYMERGAGASNLKISFNLKTIPDGTLSVHKDVENYYAPQIADTEYTMQATVDGKPLANTDYSILGTSETGSTDDEGKFSIKNNQTAVFEGIEVGKKIVVKEVGVGETSEGSEILQNYDISYTVTDSSGNSSTSSGSDGSATATMPGYGSVTVNVKNTAKYTRPVIVAKHFNIDGNDTGAVPDGFQATYTLYEQTEDSDGNPTWDEVGSIRYTDMEDGEYVFWLDVNKTYKVEETFDSAGDNNGGTTEQPFTQVIEASYDHADSTDEDSGTVYVQTGDSTDLDGTGEKAPDRIDVTNYYGTKKANFRVRKYEDTTKDNEGKTGTYNDGDKLLKGATFTLYKETEVVPTDGRPTFVDGTDNVEDNIVGNPQETGEDGLVTFSDLDDGWYWLVETTVPSGYVKSDDPIMVHVQNGVVMVAKPTVTTADDGQVSYTYGDLKAPDEYDASSNTYTMSILNKGISQIPSTGGSGTISAGAAGVAIVALAGAWFVSRRSKAVRDN